MDKDPRLLAGVASPASVTVDKGGKISPYRPYGTLSPSDSDSVGPYGTLSPSDSDSVGPCGMLSPSDSVAVGPVGPDGTLSSSNLAGILFSAVPPGIPLPLGPVGPVGPYGTLSPSATAAVGPVGPDGTLSSSDLAGILFPAIPAGILSPVGPIGPYGTLSPSDSDSVVLLDPGGTLSSSDLVGMVLPDVSVELPFLICPVKTLGALSLSDSDSVGPMGPTGMLSSYVFECASPGGPVGKSLPCDGGTGLFPIIPTGELSSVEAVPFPGKRDPAITQLPAEMLVGDCGDVVNRDVTGNSCWAVPGGIGEPAVVAMIGLDVMPMGEGVQLHGADKCAEWDIRDEFETIDGMPVYYGGDLCTSDESDWEDLYGTTRGMMSLMRLFLQIA